MAAKFCMMCGNPLGLLNTKKSADGVLCSNCASIASNPQFFTVEQIQGLWQAHAYRQSVFAPATRIPLSMTIAVLVDPTRKMFSFEGADPIYCFGEVEDADVVTTGGKVITKKKGGITRAVTGGLLFGAAGAIVGAGTAKSQTKTVGDYQQLVVRISHFTGNITKKFTWPSSRNVEFWEYCMANAEAENAIPAQPAAQLSAADEIAKFKTLLDQGVITQEEFEVKKRQLLGL